jgi:hypothetical protein
LSDTFKILPVSSRSFKALNNDGLEKAVSNGWANISAVDATPF